MPAFILEFTRCQISTHGSTLLDGSLIYCSKSRYFLLTIQTRRTCINTSGIPILSKFIGINHIRQYSRRTPTYVSLVIYTHFTFLTFLGSDQNDTIRRTCTINGTSSSIFQYRNTFNIIRIHVRKRLISTPSTKI